MDQRISFVTLAVADLAASRRFYLDGLGWRAELDVPGDDARLVPHEDQTAADEGERRLAALLEVAGQPQHEGLEPVVAHAPGGVEQPGLAQGGDGLGGEDALRDDEVVGSRRHGVLARGPRDADVVDRHHRRPGRQEGAHRGDGRRLVPAVGVVPVDHAELLAAGQVGGVEVLVEVVEAHDRPPVVTVEPAGEP